jgi:hypothetical protein
MFLVDGDLPFLHAMGRRSKTMASEHEVLRQMVALEIARSERALEVLGSHVSTADRVLRIIAERTKEVTPEVHDAVEKAQGELAEYRARDQAKRELLAEAIGHANPQSVTEHTTIEDLYHKAGKLTRAELEAERDSARALLRETLRYLPSVHSLVAHETSQDLIARISKELG